MKDGKCVAMTWTPGKNQDNAELMEMARGFHTAELGG